MDLESIFFTLCLIWYFSNYGQPYNLFLFLRRLYKEINDSLNSMKHLNTVMTSEIFANESEKDAEKREEIKYEDKFLKEFRDMNKELTLNESEQELKALKTQEYFKEINDSYMNKIEEIKFKIHENTNKLTKYEGSDDDYCIYDGKDEDAYLGETKELRIQTLLDENNNLNAELDVLKQNIDTTNCLDAISKQVEEKVNAFMFDHRLEKLKNCFVMEYTPLGNVLMFYDAFKMGFSFYSDEKTISYDILNAIAMKYVTMYRCLDFFVDEALVPKEKCSPFIKLYFTEEPKKVEENKSTLNPFAKMRRENPNIKGHIKTKEKIVEVKELLKNKFLYLGKMNNSLFLQPAPKTRKILAKFTSPLLETIKLESGVQRERISYKDFKKSLASESQEVIEGNVSYNNVI